MNIEVSKLNQKTYDTIANSYSKRIDNMVSGWIWDFEKGLIDALLFCTEKTNPCILELGCGNGKDTHYLSGSGADVLAIDISKGMLNNARKKLPRGNFFQMDMRNIAFSDNTFDAAWANGCIYHVTKNDFGIVLDELSRVLKKDGIFSFNYKIGTGELVEENPVSFGGEPRFYSYYGDVEMEEILIGHDFGINETGQYPDKIMGETISYVLATNL